ncbi:MAG: hypothetical protein AB1Z23_03585 [Eubacteriales bacterium]
MKPIKIILAFVIFYFIATSVGSVIVLADSISRGNKYIEYAFYAMIALLLLIFVIFPLIMYSFTPSITTLTMVGKRDVHAVRKYRRHLLNTLNPERKSQLKKIPARDIEANCDFMLQYLREITTEKRKAVRSTAMKLTTTVIISPNSFIDGLAVLIGNSHMIYELSKSIGVRYSWKDIINFYFNTFTIASITGIIQEFDEEIEEIVISIAQEFSELLGAESGRSITDSMPFANILSKAMVPIFEAASNYAYVVYNGNKFLSTVVNQLNAKPLKQGQVNRAARKLARREKYKYLAEMTAKISWSGPRNILKKVFSRKKKEEE